MFYVRESDSITKTIVSLSHSVNQQYQVHLHGWAHTIGGPTHQLHRATAPPLLHFPLKRDSRGRKDADNIFLDLLFCSPCCQMLQIRLSGVQFQAIWFLSSQLQIYQVRLILLSKPSGNSNAKTCFKLCEAALHEDTSTPFTFTQMLFPCLLPLQLQVPMLSSVLPFFRHLDSGLRLRLNFWENSLFSPFISSLTQVKLCPPFLLLPLSPQLQLPPTSLQTNLIPCQSFPSLYFTLGKEIIE